VRRRDISKFFLASATGTVVMPLRTLAQSLSGKPHDLPVNPESAPGISATNRSNISGALDVIRYGVVPNDSAAATSNTALLRALLDPTKSGPGGTVLFQNTTGHDVYYFNAVVPIRDGTRIDLMGCTIDYTATATAKDINSGLLFALRDFVCENGTITVACDTSAATGSGHAIQIGARGSVSSYFTVWDSHLATQMGNIQLRNLRIIVKNSGTDIGGSTAIGIFGGVQNLVAENIVIDGSGTLLSGIYYEFGWATNEAQPNLRQTSHAHNMRFTNIIVKNMSNASGIALGLVGAYSCMVDGLHVTTGKHAFLGYPGEAMFYRPWAGADQAAPKGAITLRNIVAQSLSGTAVVFTGAQTSPSGYLSSLFSSLGHPSTQRAQTDLADFSIEGFSITNCLGWGIYTSAGRADIRNGGISGCQRGVVSTDECTKLTVEGVDIVGCQQHGMQLDIGVAIWSPPRTKKVAIRDCYIAGNSTSSVGKFAGIEIGSNTDSAIIENCRIGYENDYAGVAETTQGDGIFVSSAKATNVICRDNHVGGVAGPGTSAYHSVAAGAATANGNTIERGTGLTTTVGNWSTDLQSADPQIARNNSTITTQSLRVVRVTASAAVTGVVLGAGYQRGQAITIIHEGAAANTIMFAASGTSNVADGASDVVSGMTSRTFVWDTATNLWYPNK
jgi:hypothetical protein